MAKFHSPLLGYNNNVRHRGRVFHIQTEDSGISHPHVITHLFMDGGRILKSVKKSYAEHVGSDSMKETVRVLMKEQHKAMFIALRDGQFDEIVEPGSGARKPPSDATMKEVKIPEPPETKPELPPSADAMAAASKAPESSEEPSPNTIDESRRPAAAEPFALEANGPNTVRERERLSVPPPQTAADAVRRPSAAELTLDFDALERDAGVSPIFQSNDLPPPPANLFAKERGTGAYSTIEIDPHHDDTRPATKPSVAPRRPTLPPASARTGENRYAASRPATIFGSTIKPPAAPSSSIFGEDLVSDKSLDEVILSYLAEDLEPRK